jgi:hypothetical protein
MLQIVIRPSIESASIAGAAAVLDDVPGRRRCRSGRSARMRSLAVTPGAARRRRVTAIVFGRAAAASGWPARARPRWCRCRTPARRTRRAWRCGVAADDRHARLGEPELRADDVHDALVAVAQRVAAGRRTRRSCGAASRPGAARLGSAIGRDRRAVGRDVVVLGGEREVGPAHRRPARRRPSNACGLVTSWTRCRSM